MKFLSLFILTVLTSTVLTVYAATASLLRERAVNSDKLTSSTQVDLGYSIYEGYADLTTGIYIFKGIRFAAAPLGSLRWQPPHPPTMNRSQVIMATSFASTCPQAGKSSGSSPLISSQQLETMSEDCLFLNVYTPPKATKLPVLVWIHGGGYGGGDGRQDMTSIMNASSNGFVAVTIQYRLGAFGFLSSDEVSRLGTVNAGLLDQSFALQWVKSHIVLFGGDPSRVTISGESAGGGSVMLQAIASGGNLGESLFSNIIAASPYLPMQYDYGALVPTQSYYAFAYEAGCSADTAAGNAALSGTTFECLVRKDSVTLINANAVISASGKYGTWNFLPVTDGTYIQKRPTQQLLKKQVNGVRLLVGNNANEAPSFTPQNITTEDALIKWLEYTFPLFTTDDISKLLLYYPSSNASDSIDEVRYATLGYEGATALNQSSVAAGQQQRANNIYAETTFVCPSYWLAEAFTNDGREAYKYQYSVLPATHGIDPGAYFGPPNPTQGSEFVSHFQRMWGNFIMHDNPSVPNESRNSSVAAGTNWPAYSIANPYQLNLNQTGGALINTSTLNFEGKDVYSQSYIGPGLEPNFSLVNAYTWEGGRGYRCDFWRAMGDIVPE